MNKIYLDYAATTPLDHAVAEKMSSVPFGNASSVHSFGRDALMVIDHARDGVAQFLGAQFNEVVFTSGATEANNIALMGLLLKFHARRPGQMFHIVTSRLEHASVRQVCEYIETRGLAEVTWLDADRSGVVSVDAVRGALKENTILVSLMYVNNETGAVNPIRDIGKMVKKVNEDREKEVMNRKSNGEKLEWSAFDKLYFHTDAVQAANFQNMNVQQLHVDLLSLSGHKVYGPKGVGVLFVKEGTPVDSVQWGGDQEVSLRPGTLNTASIAGLGEALASIASIRESEASRLKELKEYMLHELTHFGCEVNGSLEGYSVHISNVYCPRHAEGQILVHQLDQRGIAVSVGSACSAGAVEPSQVIVAMYNADRASHSVRISLGRTTTQEDIDVLVSALSEVVQ
jgi:cysteine desulfurase